MSLREPKFPEYGRGADRAGARRNRRAFRFFVLFFAALAASLWFAENFLRYELHQAQYLSALTQEPESARPILQRAIKDATDQGSPAVINYLQALAAREDPDEAVESYAEAYALDPATPWLALRYGVALYHSGRYEEAHARFQEAAAQPRRNALPMYFEAATIPRLPEGLENLDESLAMAARTNNSGLEIRFPAPLWFKALPENGAWHARLRREIVEQCVAILYQYAGFVVSTAQEDTPLRQAQYWVPWLEQVQAMGERLTFSADGGSLQSITGIQIQLQALKMRQEIRRRVTGEDDPEMVQQAAQLEAALAVLNAFENGRDARIAAQDALYRRPLWLILKTFAILGAAYLAAYAATKLFDAGRAAWAIPFGPFAEAALVAWCAAVFVLLHGARFLQRAENAAGQGVTTLDVLWGAALGLLVVFGALYPFLAVPGVKSALARHGGVDDADVRAQARRERRDACLMLQRRFWGAAAGLYVCSVSAWSIAYRLMAGLYPWQVNLLASGLAEDEMQAVARALSLLQ